MPPVDVPPEFDEDQAHGHTAEHAVDRDGLLCGYAEQHDGHGEETAAEAGDEADESSAYPSQECDEKGKKSIHRLILIVAFGMPTVNARIVPEYKI